MTEPSKDEIRNRTEKGRFGRGLEYHRKGRVKNRVRRGHDLEAEVEGSHLRPYMVSVSISEDGDVLTTTCSCPDDYSGDCKHVVAVLLDWLKDPDSFREVEPVELSLEDRSREELIALVQEMLDSEPHLKYLLEVPLPGFSNESSDLIDLYPYQKEVKRILDEYQGWGEEWNLASSLSAIVTRGEDHLENNEYRHAEAAFHSVIKETLEFYEYTHDEGEILREVQRATNGLIQCLNAQSDGMKFHKKIIDLLYWIVEWDIDFGGIELMGEPWKAILEHAERKDRQRLRGKVIENLEELRTKKHPHWGNNQYGRMLLDLDEIDGNIEGFLQEAEKFELHNLKALKLLELNRRDEAIKVAEKIENPFDIIEFANLLCEKNEGREARRIVSEHVERNPHDRLKEWLAEFDEE